MEYYFLQSEIGLLSKRSSLEDKEKPEAAKVLFVLKKREQESIPRRTRGECVHRNSRSQRDPDIKLL